VLADALLLGPGRQGHGRTIGEDGIGTGNHLGEVAEPGPWVGGQRTVEFDKSMSNLNELIN
jgi:hypothetical protein